MRRTGAIRRFYNEPVRAIRFARCASCVLKTTCVQKRSKEKNNNERCVLSLKKADDVFFVIHLNGFCFSFFPHSVMAAGRGGLRRVVCIHLQQRAVCSPFSGNALALCFPRSPGKIYVKVWRDCIQAGGGGGVLLLYSPKRNSFSIDLKPLCHHENFFNP